MHGRHPAIYIMANKPYGTLYTGVTSDLIKRIYQHKHLTIDCSTIRYNCKRLVYYEQCENMMSVIERKKQIKAGSRKTNILLIERMNPEWLDLYET